MTKALYKFLPALIVFSAYAQAEAPTEKASPVTVVIFLVLFVGSIAAYFGHVWWSHRKVKQDTEAKPHQ